MNRVLLFLTLFLGCFGTIQANKTTDHSKHEILQQDFKTGPDVTKACLTCHTESAKQIHKSIHWHWGLTGGDSDLVKKMGKKNVINNFCVATNSNEPRCTSCHVGFGWKDKTFDFSKEENVDCMVCHDSTGTYKKFPAGAGHPAYEDKVFKGNGKLYKRPDFKFIAQNVKVPSRKNCGTCHFYGGGGDSVKHGDLDSTLLNPPHSLDVHMSKDGANLDCIDCHKSSGHQTGGGWTQHLEKDKVTKEHSYPTISCTNCHNTADTHKGPKAKKINDHLDKVACQTCHIPQFARNKPTKMYWDWSQAGEKEKDEKTGKKSPKVVKKVFDDMIKEDGTPYKEKILVYHAKKGSFKYGINVVPEYEWSNGMTKRPAVTDKIDPNTVTKIDYPMGNYNDPKAKVFPYKVHRGKQMYDSVNNTLVIPKLFGKKGSGAYWGDWDWDKSIKAGMEYSGLPYSGKFGWTETAMYWPQNHMVAPKTKALSCNQCHAPKGRMNKLAGFYMPGDVKDSQIDKFFGILILITLLGVLGHGFLRMTSGGKKEQ